MQFADMFLHFDKMLGVIISQYGPWVYGLLFLIIFCETGLVVLPFLPGDSLLFIAGAFAAAGSLNLGLLIVLLTAAAILGNTSNYLVGNYLGPKVFQWPDSRFFSRAGLDQAHAFFDKHGGKTIVLSRFIPILRTFAPFVAGISTMSFAQFQIFNITGGLLWVASLSAAGYWFGNLPFIKDNLTLVILAIVGISLVPVLIAGLRSKKKR